MSPDPQVASGQSPLVPQSLSPLARWLGYLDAVADLKDGAKLHVRPAHEFVKEVRRILGRANARDEITQEELATLLGCDRSSVGKWEMVKGGDEPSYPYVCRLFILIGAVTKDLRPASRHGVQSAPMSNIENAILSELRKLPDDVQLAIYRHVVSEATRAEGASSQAPAAQKKG